MTKTVLEGYMSVSDVARELGRSEQTIYNWINADRITYLEVGGKPFISEKEVARLKEHGSKP